MSKDDGYKVVANDNEVFWFPASGAKAEVLKAKAAELQSLPQESSNKLSTDDTWVPQLARDFLSEPARPMTVARLNAHSGQNAVVVHDNFFQLNCVQTEARSSGRKVLTDHKERI